MSSLDPQTIAANLSRVRDRIARAAVRVDRDPVTVRLVAVAKKFPVTHVEAVAAAGLTDIGENRVQEALDKMEAAGDLDVRWHLIGHLQSNKARRAAERFAWIHSVDRVELLTRLETAAATAGTRPRLLVQVDLAQEPTKHGASVDETRRILAAARDCQHAQICGLMVLPPWSIDPERARPYFRRLRELRDGLLRDSGAPPLGELSMGMSHDFEVAIEEGATLVRVGTAIFGPRPRQPPT